MPEARTAGAASPHAAGPGRDRQAALPGRSDQWVFHSQPYRSERVPRRKRAAWMICARRLRR
jgi:hypothetical protein